MAARIKQVSSSYVPKLKHAIHKSLLTYLMVLACILGVGVGVLLRLREEPYSERELKRLRFPGDIMLNMLNLLVLPLTMSSIISGISLEETSTVGKIGLWSLAYFLFTYVVSTVLGVLLAISIFPTTKQSSRLGKASVQATVFDTVLNLIRQIFPKNLIEMTFQKTVTVFKERTVKRPAETDPVTNLTAIATSDIILQPVQETMAGVNTLGVIMMSMAGGIVINRIGDRGLPLKIFFDAVFEITMVLIAIVNWYNPIGLFFLVVENVVAMDTSQEVPQQISFFVTVISGLVIHSLFIMPFICFVVCRQNPYVFIGNIMNVLVTALGTSSSLATLPFTLHALERGKMRLDCHTVGFMAPIGASINMDGSAIFNTITVIFLGRLQGVKFGFWRILSLGLLSVAAAVADTGVPQVNLGSVRLLTDSMGLVNAKIEYIAPLNWIMDRFVTSTNVLSDAFGCAVVHHLTRRRSRLDDSDDEDESTTTYDSSSQSERTKTFATMSAGHLPTNIT